MMIKRLDSGAGMSLDPSSATYVCDLVPVVQTLHLGFLIGKVERILEPSHGVFTRFQRIDTCQPFGTGAW